METYCWRQECTWPDHVQEESADLLDLLEELLQFKWYHYADRYSAMHAFLEAGRDAGLITGPESDVLRTSLGPHM